MDPHSRLEDLNRELFEAERTGNQGTLTTVLDDTSFQLVRSNGIVNDKKTMKAEVGSGDGNNRDIIDGSLEINIYGEKGNERFGVVTCIIRMERKDKQGNPKQGISNFFRNTKVFVRGEQEDDWRCVGWQVTRV